MYYVLKEEKYKEKKFVRKEGLVSIPCIPMMVKDKVIGVLNVYTNKPYEFTKAEIILLSTIVYIYAISQVAEAMKVRGIWP